MNVPPNHEDAERSVLGCMLLSEDAIAEAADSLTEADFYRGANGRIFDAMLHLHKSGSPVDLLTLDAELKRRGELDGVGGVGYLASLVSIVPSTAHLSAYIGIVREASVKRSCLQVARDIMTAVAGDTDGATIIADAERALARIVAGAKPDTLRLAADVAADTLDDLQHGNTPTTISTGIGDVDRALGGGLQPGKLLILAGRPSMGKSTLAAQIAVNTSGTGPVLFFSLEMRAEDVVLAHLSRETGIPYEQIINRRLDVGGWTRLADKMSALGTRQLWIDDRAPQTVARVRRTAKAAARRLGQPKLVVIDYLQLGVETGHEKQRHREVGDAALDARAIAQELDCPVLLLSQLSRSVESRHDRRPMLSDLRDSGEIEQHADVVAFIYRDEYYNPDSPDRGITELIVAKQRLGRTGIMPLQWSNGKFEQLDEEEKRQWRARQSARRRAG